MSENPFTLMYGKTASSVVRREEVTTKILEEFSRVNPSIPAYLITGVRGSGKTVVLRDVARLSREKGWIVLDLNPRGDLLRSYCRTLYEEGRHLKIYVDWALNINAPYISLTIKKETPFDDPELVAKKLTEKALKEGKRILVTIDEVSPTDSLRYFSNFYQSILGLNLPLCLLMTGIKENIDAISSDKSMSFLSRSPKLALGPLDLGQTAVEYSRALGISLERAAELAKATKGYAFAYQVYGYFFYEDKKDMLDGELKEKVAKYLWQNGYDVLWKLLTHTERQLLIAIAETKTASTQEILQKTGMSMSNYQNYRRRLIDNGLLMSSGYGKTAFALPTFDEYARFMKAFE